MSEILDEVSRSEKTIELSKNGKDLNILIGIIITISGVLSIWYGIYSEITLHNSDFGYMNFTFVVEVKFALLLIISPLAIFVAGILFLLKKRIGWLASLSSCILLTVITAFIAYATVSRDYFWVYFISLLFLILTIVLVNKNFRKYYKFKLENLLYVVGIPIALMLIVLFIR